MDSSDAVIPSSSQVNLSDEKLSLNPTCQIALEKNDLEFFFKNVTWISFWEEVILMGR